MRFSRRRTTGPILALLLGAPGPSAAHAPIDVSLARATERVHAHPDDPAAYLSRAELYRVEASFREAEADLAWVRELEPEHVLVDLASGRLYLDWGRPARAEAVLGRFVVRAPRDPLGHLLRARALSRLGRRDEAVVEYGVSIEWKPGVDAYLERARVQAGDGRDREAIGIALGGLDAARVRLGPSVPLELYAIELELVRKNHPGALARIDRLAARAARKDSWLVRRGRVLVRAGRRAEAREAYTQALAAIDALPETRRSTRATVRLRTEVREALARLGDEEPAS